MDFQFQTSLDKIVDTEPAEVLMELWINIKHRWISRKQNRFILKAFFLYPGYPDEFAHWLRLGGLFFPQHA